ncbi:hypothetical protein [Chitinophaga polysaccharea]|uniref:hypothetical protein n=1 Tax=Chitinophaga polysaccharea TaxID=1293035 RepID=UPI001156E0A2|nr:hypothetical protein [Chitinophaga polysaccharea]
MSAWKKKAMECLPELKAEFEDPDTSIYDIFIALLPPTIAAHRHNDVAQLKDQRLMECCRCWVL